jgi:hypothetical protein
MSRRALGPGSRQAGDSRLVACRTARKEGHPVAPRFAHVAPTAPAATNGALPGNGTRPRPKTAGGGRGSCRSLPILLDIVPLSVTIRSDFEFSFFIALREMRRWRTWYDSLRMFQYASLDEVLDSYVEYLKVKHPQHRAPFNQRRSLDREGALAEAVIFSMLQGFGVRPEVNEAVGTGGADFICNASARSPLFSLL